MIPRHAQQAVHRALARQAAVALIGPRQVGKTTLAHAVAEHSSGAVYLDLEAGADRAKLTDARMFLAEHENRLVVFDEIRALACSRTARPHRLPPKVTRGFHSACEDIAPKSAFVVYAGAERYPLAANVEVIGLREMAAMVAGG